VNNCSQSFVDDLEEEGHKCAAGLLTVQGQKCERKIVDRKLDRY